MLLVGSKALQAYMPVDRVIHDWDIWMSEFEFNTFLEKYTSFLVKETPHSFIFDIHGEIVEIKMQKQFEPTDQKIWEQCLFEEHFNEIETPWGKCRVPNIQVIYEMKCATAACIPEWKHEYDKKLIETGYPCCIQENTELFKERLAETQARVEKSKKNLHGFFHRNAHKETKIATIPEYIKHDRLHELISDLIGKEMPVYLRITDGDYKVDMNLFHKLTYMQKVMLMVEESLVLALERWFVPQMIENGINYKLIERFYNNNEASPTYMLLKHVNIKGLIGEEPEITQFGRDNFNVIEKEWIKAKQRMFDAGGLPKWFFEEIFELRERYRNGEKVGLHHKQTEDSDTQH